KTIYRILFPEPYLINLLEFALLGGLLGAGLAGEETGLLEAGHVAGHGLALEAIDRTLSRGSDGELEPIHGLGIPELDGKHDGIGAPQGDGSGAQGHDVRI